MDYQYWENGAKNIYSNYNQMRVYVEALQIIQSINPKKIVPFRPFHRTSDETLKC